MKSFDELIMNGAIGFAIFALERGFANTKDRGNVVANGSGNFFLDVFVALIKDVATLGVADESIIDKATKLRDGNFAGVSAIIAPVEVLCGEFELAAIDLERKSLQSDKRRGKHNLKIAAGVDAAAEATEVEAGLAWSEVHFPVCNYVFFSGTSHT